MDAVKWAEIIGKISAGGWPTWIATAVLILIAIVIAVSGWGSKNAAVQKQTDEGRIEDQANTVELGQKVENQWSDASKQDQAAAIPDEHKKPRGAGRADG